MLSLFKKGAPSQILLQKSSSKTNDKCKQHFLFRFEPCTYIGLNLYLAAVASSRNAILLHSARLHFTDLYRFWLTFMVKLHVASKYFILYFYMSLTYLLVTWAAVSIICKMLKLIFIRDCPLHSNNIIYYYIRR